MGIPLGSSFTRSAGIPLDDKMTVADNTARDAIASGVRYQGMIVYVTGTAKNWQLQGGTANGNWVDISVSGGGGSSSGDENLVTNGSGESASVSIFTPYADAAGTRPVDGTGGTPNVTTALNSTNPINGLKDYTLIKDAANRQGQGWAATVSIPLAYRAKSLSVKIKYLVTSGTFVAGNNGASPADGDVIWYFYDITNSKLVEPSNIKMFSNSTTVSDMYEATVQFDSNCASVRLIAHVASTSASAYTLQIDDVTLTPNTFTFATPVTDWVAFTPTGSWSTNTTYGGFYRRNGSEMEYQMRASFSGAPGAAVALTFNLPSGHVIDNNKLSDTVASYGRLPFSTAQIGFSSSSSGVSAILKYNSTTSVAVYSLVGNFAPVYNANVVTPTAPVTLANLDFVSISFKVPLVGMDSTLQISDNVDARLQFCSIGKTANQSVNNTTSTKLTFDVVTQDTHGAWSTSNNRFTVGSAGVFDVGGQIGWAANATGYRQISILVNGTTSYILNQTTSAGAADPTTCGFSSPTPYLNAGDYFELYAYQNSGGALNASFNLALVRIVKRASPQTIAASEKVNMRYTTTAGQSLATGDTTLAWPTKDYDTHSMLSSNTTVTIKAAGVYAIHAVLHVPAGVSGLSTQLFKLLKNGTIVTECNYAKTYVVGAADKYEVYDELNLIAGDTLTVVYNNGFGVGAIPASTVAGHNSFKVHRI